MSNSIFISLEGGEGAGKTTAARYLLQRLAERNIQAVYTRQPGGSPLGMKIRELLLHQDRQPAPRAELMLFMADRAQHVEQFIRPWLEQNDMVVICDRYTDSTLAYQGFGRGIHLGTLEQLNHIATDGLVPDHTFLLDVEPEIGLARRKDRDENNLDRETLAFHRKVVEGYRLLAKRQPERFHVVDANGSLEQTLENLMRSAFEHLRWNQPHRNASLEKAVRSEVHSLRQLTGDLDNVPSIQVAALGPIFTD